MLKNASGESLVVSMAGEISILERSHPRVGLLGGVNQSFGEGALEGWARAATFRALPFEIEFYTLPKKFDREFKPLEDGIAHQIRFRLGRRLAKTLKGVIQFGLPFGETLCAHGLFSII